MDFSEAMDMSKRADRMAKDLCAELCKEIDGLPFDGVYLNDGKDGGPVMAVVKFSALGRSWSPEYILPVEQSRAVRRYLENISTADGICNAIKRIFDTGSVPICDNQKLPLNDRTINAILTSELGSYVATTIEKDALERVAGFLTLYFAVRCGIM